MATYKQMIGGQPIPPDIETPLVMPGYFNGMYVLNVGPLRIALTKGEKDYALKIWAMLENGIDPTTGEKFETAA